MSIRRRISDLEKRFCIYHSPGIWEDEAGEHLMTEAMKRLSLIELKVLSEVLEIKAANPDLSDAERWRLMTDTQQAMEPEWRRVVREVRSELEASA